MFNLPSIRCLCGVVDVKSSTEDMASTDDGVEQYSGFKPSLKENQQGSFKQKDHEYITSRKDVQQN